MRVRDGKTYYVLDERGALPGRRRRDAAEVQRIKSEGDYTAARTLFETYGVHFDPELRDEMVRRVDRLNLPSYTAFVMPTLTPVPSADGEVVDVHISYCLDFATQMLEYSADRRAQL